MVNKFGGKISQTNFNLSLLKGLILILSCCLTFVPFTANGDYFDGEIWIPFFWLFLIGIILLSCGLILVFISTKKITFSFNRIDLILFILLLSVGVNLLISENGNANYQSFCLFVIYFILYLLLKNLFFEKEKNYYIIIPILCCFLLSGILEALIGILEYFHWYKFLPTDFRINGTFGNPGPYSNYLAFLYPFAWGFFLKLYSNEFWRIKNLSFNVLGLKVKSIPLLKILCAANIISISIVLPLTNARTSWIACILSLSFVLWPYRLRFIPFLKRASQLLLIKNKVLRTLFALIILITTIFPLYKYKPQSVHGRILIYKVTLSMIKSEPFTGYGFNKFKVEYNNFQADYFQKFPLSPYSKLADSPRFAFNEYLQLWAELGLFILLFFLLLHFYIFNIYKTYKDPFLRISQSSMIALIVCAFFSYPYHNWQLLFSIILILSLISSVKKEYQIHFRNFITPMRIGCIASFVCIWSIFFFVIIKDFKSRVKWDKAIDLINNSENKKALLVYEEIYPNLKYDGFFLYNYGAEIVDSDPYKGVKLLEDALKYFSDINVYIYLGDGYRQIKQYKKAEQCYKKAINI